MSALPQITRLSLKNILFPTDFSAASRAAVPFAQRLAQTYGSTIFVEHSIPPEPHRQIVADRIPAADNVVWTDARRQIDAFTAGWPGGAGSLKTILDRGDLADVMPEIIDKYSIDMVVLGTHGRTGFSKMLLGSDAEKIYRSSTCPVLTVGPKAQAAKNWSLRRILCPVDTSEDPAPLLQYALALAEENQSELVVLEALPLVPWQHRASVEAQSRRALEEWIPDAAKYWCTLQITIRWDHPAEAILREAEERQADVIVMGVHRSRMGGWSAHLPWPVASEVVSRAASPVLTVRI